MSLILLFLVLAAVSFWAGFRAPRHALQGYSQVGFFVFLALAGFAGYFAWRESRTVGELAELIDPVPEITDVTYVPTASEMTAISQMLGSAPDGRFGSSRSERQDAAEKARERTTEYWLVKTALSSDSILAFYREAAPRRGWTIETDRDPWLMLSRGADRLVLFLDSSSWTGTQVLFAFTAGDR